MLQVCPNGPRTRAEHPHLPVTPAELASSVVDAVAAGAQDVHLHPKDPQGADSLHPDHVAAVLTAVQTAAPGIPVGVTTGAWTQPDPQRRAALIRSWSVLPDHASVNWHEDGADLVAETLLERGIDIEAGIFSGTEAAQRFLTWKYAHRVRHVLAEIVDADPASPTTLLHQLGHAHGRPILLHGEDASAWPVLRLAASRNLDCRIGLEDTLSLPNGAPAPDNTALITAALTEITTHHP